MVRTIFWMVMTTISFSLGFIMFFMEVFMKTTRIEDYILMVMLLLNGIINVLLIEKIERSLKRMRR